MRKQSPALAGRLRPQDQHQRQDAHARRLARDRAGARPAAPRRPSLRRRPPTRTARRAAARRELPAGADRGARGADRDAADRRHPGRRARRQLPQDDRRRLRRLRLPGRAEAGRGDRCPEARRRTCTSRCTARATTAWSSSTAALFWTMCTDSIGQVPTMGAAEGRLAARQVRDLSGHALRATRTRATTSRSPSTIPTTSRRGPRRSARSRSITSSPRRCSSRCPCAPIASSAATASRAIAASKAAFAFEPDISFTIARPIPGLVIRPLPTKAAGHDAPRAQGRQARSRYCPHAEAGARAGSPSRRSTSATKRKASTASRSACRRGPPRTRSR